MYSQTEELTSTLGTPITQKTPKSFTLYEEYSRVDINETIKTRRSNYEKANREGKKELEREVEAEVSNFCRWLEQTKNLEHDTAHYHATALKTLLLGLPIGEQIAQLFSVVLDVH